MFVCLCLIYRENFLFIEVDISIEVAYLLLLEFLICLFSFQGEITEEPLKLTGQASMRSGLSRPNIRD